MVGSLGFEPRTSNVLDETRVPQAGILNHARRRPLLRQSLIRTIKLKPQKERSLGVDRYFSVLPGPVYSFLIARLHT